jgi:hypothetical protein
MVSQSGNLNRMAKPPGTEKSGGNSAKAERLSAALRENLKRRKAQARGRAVPKPENTRSDKS